MKAYSIVSLTTTIIYTLGKAFATPIGSSSQSSKPSLSFESSHITTDNNLNSITPLLIDFVENSQLTFPNLQMPNDIYSGLELAKHYKNQIISKGSFSETDKKHLDQYMSVWETVYNHESAKYKQARKKTLKKLKSKFPSQLFVNEKKGNTFATNISNEISTADVKVKLFGLRELLGPMDPLLLSGLDTALLAGAIAGGLAGQVVNKVVAGIYHGNITFEILDAYVKLGGIMAGAVAGEVFGVAGGLIQGCINGYFSTFREDVTCAGPAALSAEIAFLFGSIAGAYGAYKYTRADPWSLIPEKNFEYRPPKFYDDDINDYWGLDPQPFWVSSQKYISDFGVDYKDESRIPKRVATPVLVETGSSTKEVFSSKKMRILHNNKRRELDDFSVTSAVKVWKSKDEKNGFKTIEFAIPEGIELIEETLENKFGNNKEYESSYWKYNWRLDDGKLQTTFVKLDWKRTRETFNVPIFFGLTTDESVIPVGVEFVSKRGIFTAATHEDVFVQVLNLEKGQEHAVVVEEKEEQDDAQILTDSGAIVKSWVWDWQYDVEQRLVKKVGEKVNYAFKAFQTLYKSSNIEDSKNEKENTLFNKVSKFFKGLAHYQS